MATTLADIILAVRRRSNMEENFFVTDVELAAYINSSLAELDDILVTDYEDYRVTTYQSILQSNDNNTIPIPSSLYKLRGVDYQAQNSPGNQNWYTLYAFQLTERNRNNNNALTNLSVPYGVNRSYRLSDAGIIILPQQQCQGTYQIWYVPKFIPLVELTDTLTIQMDTQAWVEYAVVDCCIKILNKQRLDPTGFMADKAALQLRIRNAAKNRDSAGPKRVANTRFNGNGNMGGITGTGGWGIY